MKQSLLHAQHQGLGAHFASYGDWEMPEHYGNPKEEHLAIRGGGIGIADLSLRGMIEVTGEDRTKWIQSIISNDILSLQTGQGIYSAFMNNKGKMLSYFRVYIHESSILLEDVGEIGEATFQTFRKFLLYGTNAKMKNLNNHWGLLLITGQGSPQLIHSAFGLDVTDLHPMGVKTTNIEEYQALVAKTEETGEIDFEIFVPNEVLSYTWDKLWEVGQSLDLRPIGRTALESLRIEAGLPKAGPDLNEHIVPPEANLEGKAFSLSKGCYPGQEVVARMDTYGTVKRRLVGLIIETSSHQLPDHGAKLLSGDREVGWITSTAYSPTLDKSLALGFPLRDFTKPETELSIEIQGQRYPAIVHPLPFYSHP